MRIRYDVLEKCADLTPRKSSYLHRADFHTRRMENGSPKGEGQQARGKLILNP